VCPADPDLFRKELKMKISKTYLRVALIIGLATGFGSALTAEVKLPAPVIAQPTEPPNVIDYPDCPAGFTLKQKGAHIFKCRAIAQNVNDLPALVQVAQATPCVPAQDWDGPNVTAYQHNFELRVDFRCNYTP
jgi:hypothetical protein